MPPLEGLRKALRVLPCAGSTVPHHLHSMHVSETRMCAVVLRMRTMLYSLRRRSYCLGFGAPLCPCMGSHELYHTLHVLLLLYLDACPLLLSIRPALSPVMARLYFCCTLPCLLGSVTAVAAHASTSRCFRISSLLGPCVSFTQLTSTLLLSFA